MTSSSTEPPVGDNHISNSESDANAMGLELEYLGDHPPPPLHMREYPSLLYILCGMAGLGGFLFGYNTGVIAGVMLLIRVEWKLDDLWQEVLVSGTIGGAVVGSVVGGWLTDRVGRKPSVLLSAALFTLGAFFMAFSPNKQCFLVGRLIVGVGLGIACMTIPAYISETCPPWIRGKMVTIFQLQITLGFLVSAIADGIFSYMDPSISWRWMVGLGAIPGIVQLIGFSFMPESPRYAMQKGKTREAEGILRRVMGNEELVKHEHDAILRDIRLRNQENIDPEKWIITQMLEKDTARRALLLGCSVHIFQQLTGINCVMYYSSSIFQMAGIRNPKTAIWMTAVVSAVNFLCVFVGLFLVERTGRRRLFLTSLAMVVLGLVSISLAFMGIAAESPLSTPSAFSPLNHSSPCLLHEGCSHCSYDPTCGFCYSGNDAQNITGVCFPIQTDSVVNSKFGPCQFSNSSDIQTVGNMEHSKWNFAINWCPTTVAWIPIIPFIFYICAFSSGSGPVPWVLIGEIFPNWARSTGTALSVTCNWSADLVVSLTFLSLARVISREGVFLLYAGITSCAVCVLWVLVPETKGKTMEDIEELFRTPFSHKLKQQLLGYQSLRPTFHQPDLLIRAGLFPQRSSD